MPVHKSKGKTLGLGICGFFAAIFDSNEVVSKRKKLTDEEIMVAVENEFPDRPSAHSFRGENKTRTINEYRLRYNQGKFSPQGKMPERRSFRYNKDGERVDGRKGNRLLNQLEIDGFISSHKYWRDKQNGVENG